MTPRALVLALVFSLAASSLANAQTPAASMDASPKGPAFLNPEALKPQFILPAPYADGSPQALAELAETRAADANASAAARALSTRDGDTENVTFYADTLPGFDVTKLPATKKLFDEVRTDEAWEAGVAKTVFARHRPYQIDTSIQTCEKPTTKLTSYPSGHATMGYAMGLVLARLVPEKAPDIMARARLYAENRLVCGVHYRSDIVAGQTLGTAVAVLMMQDPRFQADMAAAHAELVKAGVAKAE